MSREIQVTKVRIGRSLPAAVFPACFTRRWKEFLDIKAYHFPSTQKTLIVFWSRTNNLLHLYAFHLIGSRGDGPFSRFLKTLYYTSLVLLICNNKRSCKGKKGAAYRAQGRFIYFVLQFVVCVFKAYFLCMYHEIKSLRRPWCSIEIVSSAPVNAEVDGEYPKDIKVLYQPTFPRLVLWPQLLIKKVK